MKKRINSGQNHETIKLNTTLSSFTLYKQEKELYLLLSVSLSIHRQEKLK